MCLNVQKLGYGIMQKSTEYYLNSIIFLHLEPGGGGGVVPLDLPLTTEYMSIKCMDGLVIRTVKKKEREKRAKIRRGLTIISSNRLLSK